jgi:hypothetical protein
LQYTHRAAVNAFEIAQAIVHDLFADFRKLQTASQPNRTRMTSVDWGSFSAASRTAIVEFGGRLLPKHLSAIPIDAGRSNQTSLSRSRVCKPKRHTNA